MRFIATLFCVCSALTLAGCAGTSLSVQRPFVPAVGERFEYELVPQVEMAADALVMLDTRLKAQLVDKGPASPGGMVRKVEITITRYLTRTPVGVEAPANDIVSQVTVRDAASGAVLGAFSVESKNPGTWRTTRVLLEEHADRIARYLRNRS